MKKLFLLFIVLLLAIGLGFLIHQDPGYAMVSYRHWMIATSIWVAGACLLFAFIIFYIFIRIIKNIFSIPKMLARRKKFRDAKKYRQYMVLGISMLASGNHKKAEKYFLKLKKRNLMSDEEFNKIQDLAGSCCQR